MQLLKLLSILAASPALAENQSEREMGPLLRYDAPEEATASVILLHGIGNSSDVFTPFPPAYYAQDRFRHINFLFPNAPVRDTPYWHDWTGGDPLTRSWFNVSLDDRWLGYDQDQYWEIAEYIEDLVKNETAHGIPADRIVVGGFSQGGMAALGALASIQTKIGGCLIFASEIPNPKGFAGKVVDVNKETPAFHGHGYNDTAISYKHAVFTAEFFKENGFNYDLHLYQGMGHRVDWEENDRDVEEWLARVLPKETATAPKNFLQVMQERLGNVYRLE